MHGDRCLSNPVLIAGLQGRSIPACCASPEAGAQPSLKETHMKTKYEIAASLAFSAVLLAVLATMPTARAW
jgi:hypothetical protein